jgi:hypothetical protein
LRCERRTLGESEATRKLYSIGEKPTDVFGTECLLARRLVG